MAGSLQDQLLNAGLSDAKKAKKLDKEKRKQKRTAQKSRTEVVDEVKLAAQRARDDKAARDRELNQARNLEAQRKAIEAQIVQLIDKNKLDRKGGDIGFNFTDEQKIKKIYVSGLQQKLLAAGKVAIAAVTEGYELIPSEVAHKIAERDATRVIFCTESTADALEGEERDWYKDYEIPDDLMW
ncbi:DUF2058 domain-containing protein [Congregibacter litoralis]|uniref:Nucleoprotein/polynucleotide-associated enzyme n=1 Tax=Congregibacter litoralis KT71 TaxID=314285 RepID=A4ADB7_9GAMM|nr:DUF2058 domain-containing protein [Congregibacter litoralis]EAQ96041.1 hypothetical protein KT71_12900 [Congregibacter litoralis KT71]